MKTHLTATLLATFAIGSSLATPTPLTREQVQIGVLRMDAVAERAMRTSGIPGMAIAVVHNDEVIFLKGYGVRKVGTSQPVTPDTVFQIASVSKPISSTIVAGLVGDGTVTWDEPLVNNLPNFRLSNPAATRAVSLRDAFSHRTGLPPHAGDLLENLGFPKPPSFAASANFPSSAGSAPATNTRTWVSPSAVSPPPPPPAPTGQPSRNVASSTPSA